MFAVPFIVAAFGLFAAPPGEGELDPDATEDVSTIDRVPPTAAELRARAEAERAPELVEVVVERREQTRSLELEQGQTVFIPLRIPLDRAPDGPVVARVGAARSPQLFVAPWVESVRVEPWSPSPKSQSAKKKRRKTKRRPIPKKRMPSFVVRGDYAVRAVGHIRRAKFRLGSLIEIVELRSGRVLAQSAIEHEVVIRASTLDLESVRRFEQAAALFSRELESLRAELPSSLDTANPTRSLKETDRATVARYLETRLRYELSLERLRGVAQVERSELVKASILALGQAETQRKPNPNNDNSSKSIEELLEMAQTSLSTLRVGRLEQTITTIRRRSDLTRAELAKTLLYTGADQAIRGLDEPGRQEIGRALCLDPSLGSPDPRPPIKTLFESVRAEARCKTPLAAVAATAELVNGAAGDELLIRARFAPDPLRLIAGGEVRIFSGGGGMITSKKVRASYDAEALIEARFEDVAELLTLDKKVLVQVHAKDLSGITVAALGDPNPESLSIGEAETYGKGVPWWVWLVGGVAVAGAAAATTVVLVSQSDGTRGIGPIDASF